MGIFKAFRGARKKKRAARYRLGMSKTRDNLVSRLDALLEEGMRLDERIFDDIEEIFIEADIGVDAVLDFVGHLRETLDLKAIETAEDLREQISDAMFRRYVKDAIVDTNLNIVEGLSVFLFVGVNGTGKTTTIAKVAKLLTEEGHRVMTVAADTFRAGAIEQLRIWSERAGCDFFAKDAGSDPSSVIFDAIREAKTTGVDIVLCDTAGRLQNKKNLMLELGKVHKVIGRSVAGAPHETLLVIDATTGQNGLSQAKVFDEATTLTGIVLTKLDGTAKGGIALAVKDRYDIPVKFVGLGEKIDDLEHFDIETYIYGLFTEAA